MRLLVYGFNENGSDRVERVVFLNSFFIKIDVGDVKYIYFVIEIYLLGFFFSVECKKRSTNILAKKKSYHIDVLFT